MNAGAMLARGERALLVEAERERIDVEQVDVALVRARAALLVARVEGEHVVAVGNLLGGLPSAVEAFPAALTLAEVEAAVAPFIMGGMMPTGGEEYRDRTSFGRV